MTASAGDKHELPGRSGQCKSLPPFLRHVSTRVLFALEMTCRAFNVPTVSLGRNGRGTGYWQLWFYLPNGHWKSLYLGQINTNDERLLRDAIHSRWPVTHSELNRTIRTLRAQRRQIRLHVHKLAQRCGYRCHGWMLHSRKRDS